MKRTIVWIIVGVLGLGLLFILPGLLMGGLWGRPFGFAQGWGYGPGGMMGGYGGGMMGGGMMGGYGGYGYSPFDWIGMLIGWLIPLGVLALLIAGGVWLVRRLATPGGPTFIAPAAPAKTCPNCGKGVQADWQACPHCGTTL